MSEPMATKTGYASDARQFLTFALGGEQYGVEILKVQEIKGFSAITPLPNTPAYLKGVLNLRGTIVPIVDLRKKFGFPEVPYDKFTVIVVVQVQGPPPPGEAGGPAKTMGFIVDAVSDVLNIGGREIQPTPDLPGQVGTAFITGLAAVKETATGGLAKAGDKLVILLDIEKVLSAAEAAETAPTVAGGHPAVMAAGCN